MAFWAFKGIVTFAKAIVTYTQTPLLKKHHLVEVKMIYILVEISNLTKRGNNFQMSPYHWPLPEIVLPGLFISGLILSANDGHCR